MTKNQPKTQKSFEVRSIFQAILSENNIQAKLPRQIHVDTKIDFFKSKLLVTFSL